MSLSTKRILGKALSIFKFPPVVIPPLVIISCDPKLGFIFVPAMAALAFISALTILRSDMFALVTVIAVGNAPVASFVKSIAALLAIFALSIAPALTTIFAPLLETVTSPKFPSVKVPCGPAVFTATTRVSPFTVTVFYVVVTLTEVMSCILHLHI